MRPGWITLLILGLASADASGKELEVGPGKPFVAIEKAYAAAEPGDVVLIHPLPEGKPYERVALYVTKPRITFRGAGGRVSIAGRDFEYAGRGRIPRAILQFNEGADHGVVENLELFDAHNNVHNGAGIRINRANHVTIRNCEIHGCDMGVMSNGDWNRTSGLNQRFEFCVIHSNGSEKDPGYNHNLYLDGASATLFGCEVYGSITGHNVKSRAHFTRIEACFIHHSSSRECDLVESGETAAPNSHAVLIGNLIVKNPRCTGNRTVIHYGQDGGGKHDGTLFLIHNTIVTPFKSPVVDLSTPKAKAHLVNNLVWDGGANLLTGSMVRTRNGANPLSVTGRSNWLSFGFGTLAATSIKHDVRRARWGESPPFVDSVNHDYRLKSRAKHIVDAGVALETIKLPATPGAPPSGELALWSYERPSAARLRKIHGAPDLGAYEFSALR